MDEKKLAKLFYEQAKTFAEIHNVPKSSIAAAQFHASVQMTLQLNGPDNVANWIELRAAEFRETLRNYPTWFDRGASAK
ncbi:MAG: hypothetical protein OER97_05035 [Gammaproteobacteria bacterium]|nr:hypothetical protein [Gammaproteobacteria bacterium]